MRNTLIGTLIIGLLSTAVAQGAQYAEIELTYLQRSDADGTRLAGVRPVFGQPFTATLEADDLSLDWEPGINLSYGWDSRWGQLEARLSYLGEWSDDLTVIDTAQDLYLSPGGAFPQLTLLVGDSGDFNNAYAHSFEYESRAFGLQLLRKQPLSNPRHTLVYGLNYLNLDEDFKWVGYDELDDFQGTDTDIGRYRIDTQNHLVGLTIGAEGRLAQIGSKGRLIYAVDGGLYANRARQSSTLHVQNAHYASGSESAWELAYRAGARLGLEFDLAANTTIGAGINGMWLSGVALAPEQVDQVTPALVSSAQSAADASVRYNNRLDTGDLSLYGAYLNLRLVF